MKPFLSTGMRFDALREVCNLLDRLDELEAGQLFWGDLPGFKDPAEHIAWVRSHIARFDDEIRVTLEKQANLKAQFNQRLDEFEYLNDEIHDVHARDERREDEYAIERELSPVPDHPLVMPWSDDDESERRYRRTLLITMFISLLLGIITRLVTVPEPVRPAVVEIPERLAMMVRKEHKKPEPVKKAKEVKKEAKKEAKKQTDRAQEKPTQERPKTAPAVQVAAPKKSETHRDLEVQGQF